MLRDKNFLLNIDIKMSEIKLLKYTQLLDIAYEWQRTENCYTGHELAFEWLSFTANLNAGETRLTFHTKLTYK